MALCQLCNALLVVKPEDVGQLHTFLLRHAAIRESQLFKRFIDQIRIILAHSLALGPLFIIKSVFFVISGQPLRVRQRIQKLIVSADSAAVLRYDIALILRHPRILLRIFLQNLFHLDGVFPVISQIVCICKFLRISHQFIDNRTAGDGSGHVKVFLHPVISHPNSHCTELKLIEMVIRPAEYGLNNLVQLLKRNPLRNQNPSPDWWFTPFYNDLELISSHENFLLLQIKSPAPCFIYKKRRHDNLPQIYCSCPVYSHIFLRTARSQTHKSRQPAA